MIRQLLACALAFAAGVGIAAAQDRPGDFDFFVLALSWSPTWCAQEGDANAPQCRTGAGFIVHGLWPQYEAGFPQFCGEPEWVPEPVVRGMLDIMPERRLVIAEWRKHGTCSGLPPEDYFAVTREAFDAVAIPPELRRPTRDRRLSARQIETAFAAANPGLSAGGIALSCDAGMLEDIRICLTRDLAFRPCREVDRRGCMQARLNVPAAE